MIFMNSENNKTFDSHRLILNLSHKTNLKRSNILLFMEKYKKSYNNDKFKISAPTWNENFELPEGSYSISDIQGYLKHIIKNMKQ